MPFTLAHPAAVLQLRRGLGRFGATAPLVIGSMIPDLAYFFPLGVTGSQSHGLPGLFWFCLPAGVTALVVHDLLIAPFATAVLPSAMSRRLPRVRFDVRRLPSAAPPILLGAISHLAWDSFTHSTGIAVQAFPVLRAPVPLSAWCVPQVFTLLQHASTVLGVALLTVWGVHWFRSAPLRVEHDLRPLSLRVRIAALTALLLAPVVAAVSVLWPRLDAGENSFRVVRQAIGRTTFTAGTAFLVALILTAAVWRAALTRIVAGEPSSRVGAD